MIGLSFQGPPNCQYLGEAKLKIYKCDKIVA